MELEEEFEPEPGELGLPKLPESLGFPVTTPDEELLELPEPPGALVSEDPPGVPVTVLEPFPGELLELLELPELPGALLEFSELPGELLELLEPLAIYAPFEPKVYFVPSIVKVVLAAIFPLEGSR